MEFSHPPVFYREIDLYMGIFCLKDLNAKYGCFIQYSCLLCNYREGALVIR